MLLTVTATTASDVGNRLPVYAKLWSLVLPSSLVFTLLCMLVVLVVKPKFTRPPLFAKGG